MSEEGHTEFTDCFYHVGHFKICQQPVKQKKAELKHDSRFMISNSLSPTEQFDQVRVIVRCRPLNQSERNTKRLISCNNQYSTISAMKPDGKLHNLTFNSVFNENSSQEIVFEESGVKNLILKALEGYSTTCFAFGQTGSGKSYTITGIHDQSGGFSNVSPIHAGLVPRSLDFLYQCLLQSQQDIKIKAQYLEIYNENVIDLLSPSSKQLAVRWNSSRGFYVESSLVVECDNLQDCMAVLQEGLRNRHTASHNLNEHSSRSHGILTLFIDCDYIDSENQVIKRTGKISFVDLAGSEKISDSKASGNTLVETLSINKSLLTLGKCISSLSDSTKRVGHIPYRDSTLTKLLSDSLGGEGLALMIACISPSAKCATETLKTLRYAQRARKIKNKPLIRIGDPKEEMIARLKRDLKNAQLEGDLLRAKLIENERIRPMNQSYELQPINYQSLSRNSHSSYPHLQRQYELPRNASATTLHYPQQLQQQYESSRNVFSSTSTLPPIQPLQYPLHKTVSAPNFQSSTPSSSRNSFYGNLPTPTPPSKMSPNIYSPRPRMTASSSPRRYSESSQRRDDIGTFKAKMARDFEYLDREIQILSKEETSD